MFQEKDLEVVGFDSSWKKEKVIKDQNIQTSEFSTKDKCSNTTLSKSIEVQTDVVANSNETDIDMEKLAKWLQNIYPKVVSELNDTSLNSALASTQTYKPSKSVIKILQKVDVSTGQTNDTSQLYVSAISWNCTGNTVAVSCSYKHDVWCYHEGKISVFTFSRNEQLSETPKTRLKSGSCITTLSFHPLQPSMLAGGTISGEVYLWTLQDEGDSLLSMYTAHDDRISLVSWISTMDKKSSISLISAGLDSFLTVWKIHDSTLSVDQRYKCQNYNSKIYSPNVEMIPKKTDRGIVCFDFSPHLPGLFVVAMEGGYILKCSLIGAKLVPGNKIKMSVLDPFVSSFNSHDGEITNIAFSPHRKELFFSSGTDDQIKIFHIDQEAPVQIIFADVPINFASWILWERNLLVAISDNGSVILYSLVNGQKIDTNTHFPINSLTSMAVNHKRVNILAVGSNEGVLTFWSIPWNNIAKEIKN